MASFSAAVPTKTGSTDVPVCMHLQIDHVKKLSSPEHVGNAHKCSNFAELSDVQVSHYVYQIQLVSSLLFRNGMKLLCNKIVVLSVKILSQIDIHKKMPSIKYNVCRNSHVAWKTILI